MADYITAGSLLDYGRIQVIIRNVYGNKIPTG
jgi:hypothetical protein